MSECRHGVPLFDYCSECIGEPAASAEEAGECPECFGGKWDDGDCPVCTGEERR